MSEVDDQKYKKIAARFLVGARKCGMEAVTVDLSEFTLQDIDAAKNHWQSAIATFRDSLIFRIGDQLPLTLEIRWINPANPLSRYPAHLWCWRGVCFCHYEEYSYDNYEHIRTTSSPLL
ncbi:MAG: hypothetical protein JWN75_31 [Candidatus Saccharibacteria bacterium]|nr:hypothetical protein [Candidatus Saccharibacteria bacterium]